MKATYPAAAQLLAVSRMVNQAVGDAISGILLVEACLLRRGWGLGEWGALYCDLPSRQLKLRVTDRNVVRTEDADRRVTAPPGLQAGIDAAVQGVPSGKDAYFAVPQYLAYVYLFIYVIISLGYCGLLG
jgi:phosphoacetylglucosamine mutase